MTAHRAIPGGERRLAALLANNLDAIAVFDRTGSVLFSAGAIERVLGCSPGEVLGLNAFDHIHPDDLARTRALFEECIARGGEAVTAVFRTRHSDGAWRTVEAVVASRLGDPEVGGVVANFRDISERTKLEARLLEMQKMEAIGRMASAVAHDFNNLLTGILGFGDVLAARAGHEPHLAPAIDEIRKAGERARVLTHQLLSLGRRQELRSEVFDLTVRLHDVRPLVRRLLGTGIELRMNLEPGVGLVIGDPTRIEQAVFNLVINARDAIDGEGTVFLDVQGEDLDEQAARRHAGVRPGRYTVVSVTDDGPGIDAEVLPHVFEPFFTTKEPGKGTGLGLSNVYNVVRQMGGFVEIETEPGMGTEVRVFLPRAVSGSVRQEEPEGLGRLDDGVRPVREGVVGVGEPER